MYKIGFYHKKEFDEIELGKKKFMNRHCFIRNYYTMTCHNLNCYYISILYEVKLFGKSWCNTFDNLLSCKIGCPPFSYSLSLYSLYLTRTFADRISIITQCHVVGYVYLLKSNFVGQYLTQTANIQIYIINNLLFIATSIFNISYAYLESR